MEFRDYTRPVGGDRIKSINERKDALQQQRRQQMLENMARHNLRSDAVDPYEVEAIRQRDNVIAEQTIAAMKQIRR